MGQLLEQTLLSSHELTLLSKSHQPYVVKLRRRLHEIPELSWNEEKTLALIKNEIHSIMSLYVGPYNLYEKKGGLILDLIHPGAQETSLFRADVDALPIQEETNVSYSSKHPGIMHACGHDCHAAMLLGMLKVLIDHKIPLQKNLRLVWQRAEETASPCSGGFDLIQDKILDGVDEVFALHISPTLESGAFQSRPGPMMANSALAEFKIKCTGGHVMSPEKGSNAVDIMTDLHLHLRGFALRHFGPQERISFVPSISCSGNAVNIMPSSCHCTYAIRNFLTKNKLILFLDALKNRIEAIIKTYPDAHLLEFNFIEGFPPLINNPELFSKTNYLLLNAGFNTDVCNLQFSGEDFAYYCNKKPGVYWVLGAHHIDSTDHHTSKFNPNESVLWMGVAFWLLLATNSTKR